MQWTGATHGLGRDGPRGAPRGTPTPGSPRCVGAQARTTRFGGSAQPASRDPGSSTGGTDGRFGGRRDPPGASRLRQAHGHLDDLGRVGCVRGGRASGRWERTPRCRPPSRSLHGPRPLGDAEPVAQRCNGRDARARRRSTSVDGGLTRRPPAGTVSTLRGGGGSHRNGVTGRLPSGGRRQSRRTRRFKTGKPRRASGVRCRQRHLGATDSPAEQGLEVGSSSQDG